MVKDISVDGFDECMKTIESNRDKNIYLLFSGSVDAAGKSWCPDCVRADPVVHECAKDAGGDDVFIHCSVGARDFWKDKSNIFRTHDKLRLKSVPTLLKWGKPQRLEEGQCADKDLVAMFFEEN